MYVNSHFHNVGGLLGGGEGGKKKGKVGGWEEKKGREIGGLWNEKSLCS